MLASLKIWGLVLNNQPTVPDLFGWFLFFPILAVFTQATSYTVW